MKRLALILLCLAGGAMAEETPPLSRYADLVQRPLFTPTRRPSGGLPAAKLAGSALRLTGLVAEEGRTIALIKGDEQKTETRIGPGTSLNGWQVAAIDGRGLELVAGARHLHVGLKQAIPRSPE